MYQPGDLVSEVVVWEVVEYDAKKKMYKCKEKKGERVRFFQQDEIGVHAIESGIDNRS